MRKFKKRLILEAFKDDEFGNVGLRVQGAPLDANAASDGLTIAHDIIEHVNGIKAIGGIDDELEALGAIWYVRGRYNDLRRDNIGAARDVYENIAADIVRMFRDFFYGVPVDLTPIRTLACEADDDFRAIVEAAKSEALGEIDDEERHAHETLQKRTNYLRVCLPRMRRGYRKAARKYGSGRVANNLFWEVADAVNPHAKHCDEGQQFELVYGIDEDGGTFARCDEYYGEG